MTAHAPLTLPGGADCQSARGSSGSLAGETGAKENGDASSIAMTMFRRPSLKKTKIGKEKRRALATECEQQLRRQRTHSAHAFQRDVIKSRRRTALRQRAVILHERSVRTRPAPNCQQDGGFQLLSP